MIDNKHMSEFIPPAAIGKTAGTWTPAIANNLPNEARGAADGNFTLLVPITVPIERQLSQWGQAEKHRSVLGYVRSCPGCVRLVLAGQDHPARERIRADRRSGNRHRGRRQRHERQAADPGRAHPDGHRHNARVGEE